MLRYGYTFVLLISLISLSACNFNFSDNTDDPFSLNDIAKDRDEENRQQDGSEKKRDISAFVGENVEKVSKQFGKPSDEGLSAYDYKWLIYDSDLSQYIQFGQKDGKITTIFLLGENHQLAPFQIGQSYEELNESIHFKKELTLHHDGKKYQFTLTDEEVLSRPLVKINDKIYAQLYMDRFNAQLVAVRFLDVESLLMQRPYQLLYEGSLIEPEQLDTEERRVVEASNETQIHKITNALRVQYGKTTLRRNDKVAEVAFKHSKDMFEEDYFDHVSPQFGSLENRLENDGISYFQAGENIAAQYPDGPAAVMGWLNSKGHREILFHKNFTDLGVGVYEKYYTQDFIAK